MSQRSIELLVAERDKLLKRIDEEEKNIENLNVEKEQYTANIAKWRKQADEFDDDIMTLETQ